MAVAEPKMLKLPAPLEVIRGNILKYGNPLGIKDREITAWAEGLNLPLKGKNLFYPAGEYQLLPYLDSLVGALEKMEVGSLELSVAMGVRGFFDRFGVNLERIYAGARAKDRARFQEIPRRSAQILQMLGVEISWLGEKETYSGALLYEFGYRTDLEEYAQKLTRLFQESGAETIITLSPHTAEVLKNVYPTLVPSFSFEVKTFLEVVGEKLKNGHHLSPRVSGKVVIHDACRMARELGITEEIREVLGSLEGIKAVDPVLNRRWTSCCGGPAKMLFPEISRFIAERRVEELAATGAEIAVTFCPYCLAQLNLGKEKVKAKLQLFDFAELL